MIFDHLANSILSTHSRFQQSAVRAINLHITIRNWLIGYYIVEFELKGEDRSTYGDNLLQKLSEKFSEGGLSYRNLRLYRQFYQEYSQLAETIPDQLKKLQILDEGIWQSPIAKLQNNDNEEVKIWQSPIAKFESKKTDLSVPSEKLITKLSFTHFIELFAVKDSLKRTFYEIECIKGSWSVRELHRQIYSLYFERSGISKKPENLSTILSEKSEKWRAEDVVKSIYTFEFLGLPSKHIVQEADLESSLLDHLQEFLLEMGHGFCLEGRQKKILIGDEYYFVDLVFYHRILKCHILLELKIEEFSHANAGQLNTYLNYYKKEVMREDDNLPVGILLVTNKNETLVQYATAGMDNHLFVSKYLIELPSRQQLEDFMKNELNKL